MYRALWYRRHSGATRTRQCTRRYAPRALTDPRGPFVPPSHNAQYIMLKSLMIFRLTLKRQQSSALLVLVLTGVRLWHVGFSHKGPVIRKSFLCHEVIIYTFCNNFDRSREFTQLWVRTPHMCLSRPRRSVINVEVSTPTDSYRILHALTHGYP